MVYVSLMFMSEWREFTWAPCLAEKITWWPLALPCCWNRAPRMTCFLSSSVTRKDSQFGTRKDPSFQRHYRFRPKTWEVGRVKDLLAPPRLYKTSNLVCFLCMIYLFGQECYTRRDEKRQFSGLVCTVREYIYVCVGVCLCVCLCVCVCVLKSRVINKLLKILQIWNFRNQTNEGKLHSRRNWRQGIQRMLVADWFQIHCCLSTCWLWNMRKC